jgi:hypothetical protein
MSWPHHQSAPARHLLRRFENLISFVIYEQQNADPRTLVRLAALLGERFRLYGGQAYTGFYAVERLMLSNLEKADWFFAASPFRADYLTPSYPPFLPSGPNHLARRSAIIRRSARARDHLDELQRSLAGGAPRQHALLRFLFQHFGKIEASDAEIVAVLDYSTWARRLIPLPRWFRTRVFAEQHRRLTETRRRLLDRIHATGEPFADSMFDLIWVKAAPLEAITRAALAAVKQRPDLREALESELALPLSKRSRSLAFVHELVRLNPWPSTIAYVDGDAIKIAVLASATLDPARYVQPGEIDLDRDHSDALGFAQPSVARSCPAHALAPELIACIVAHELRSPLPPEPRRQPRAPIRIQERQIGG